MTDIPENSISPSESGLSSAAPVTPSSPERQALRQLQGRLKKNLHLKRAVRESQDEGSEGYAPEKSEGANADADSLIPDVPAEQSRKAISTIRNFRFPTDVLMDNPLFQSRRPIVLGVTSSITGEGKTTVALHLALDMMRSESQRACLIDMSLNENTLSRQLGIGIGEGLVQVLEGTQPDISSAGTIEYEGLSILPAGKTPNNAARVARSPALPEILNEARKAFDVIILDLPAVTSGNVSPIARYLDGVLVVINAGVTPKETVAGALERLDQSKVMGIVLNHFTLSLPS